MCSIPAKDFLSRLIHWTVFPVGMVPQDLKQSKISAVYARAIPLAT
jgi:hypothetical protein